METIYEMETILFCNINVDEVNNSRASEIIPFMQIIASEWNLKLSDRKQYAVVRKIFINSIRYN